MRTEQVSSIETSSEGKKTKTKTKQNHSFIYSPPKPPSSKAVLFSQTPCLRQAVPFLTILFLEKIFPHVTQCSSTLF